MSNMSYCRFRNTLEDLKDCADHIYDGDLSDEEVRARKRLIKVAFNIVSDFLDEGELDNGAVDNLPEGEDDEDDE